MAIVRSNGGTEKITIDGKKVHERMNLKSSAVIDTTTERADSIYYNGDRRPLGSIFLKEPYSAVVTQYSHSGDYYLAVDCYDIEKGMGARIRECRSDPIYHYCTGAVCGEYVYYSFSKHGTNKANLKTREITWISNELYRPIFSFKNDIYLGGFRLNPDGSMTSVSHSIPTNTWILYFENEQFLYAFPESGDYQRVGKFDGKTSKAFSAPCFFQNGSSAYVYEEMGRPILFSHPDDSNKIKVYKLNENDTFTLMETRSAIPQGYTKFKGKTYGFSKEPYRGTLVYKTEDVYKKVK